MSKRSLIIAAVVFAAVLFPTGALAAPAPEAVKDGAIVEVIPAFDDDFAKGSITYGSHAQRPAPQTSSAAGTVCTLYASDPDGFVFGSGDQTCSQYTSQTLNVTLQRHRWYGWQNMDNDYQGPVGATYLSGFASWDCSGSGTYTYRIVSDGSFADDTGSGSFSVQSLNYYTVTC